MILQEEPVKVPDELAFHFMILVKHYKLYKSLLNNGAYPYTDLANKEKNLFKHCTMVMYANLFQEELPCDKP